MYFVLGSQSNEWTGFWKIQCILQGYCCAATREK